MVEGLMRASTEVQSARIGRALITDRQLDDVVTDSGLDRFSVFSGKGAVGRHLLAEHENDVIRLRAIGGGVRRGRVHGQWPERAREQLS